MLLVFLGRFYLSTSDRGSGQGRGGEEDEGDGKDASVERNIWTRSRVK